MRLTTLILMPALILMPPVLLSACSGGGQDQAASTQPEKPAAFADLKGDPARGEALFRQCSACHSVEAGKNGIGPTLHAIVGSKAGDVPGYGFSAAMKSSGIVWTPEQLYNFLEMPQAKVPGTRMSFGGMYDGQSRADIIAYLAAQK